MGSNNIQQNSGTNGSSAGKVRLMSLVPSLSEEQAGVSSSDSEEESEEEKSQGSLRAKQLPSDEVKSNLFNSEPASKEELTVLGHNTSTYSLTLSETNAVTAFGVTLVLRSGGCRKATQRR